eukprot:m.35485 g.35485  ORF g.35485 m.35485 type:complete len:525 (+) comp17145_c0_seq3:98-1672(+)
MSTIHTKAQSTGMDNALELIQRDLQREEKALDKSKKPTVTNTASSSVPKVLSEAVKAGIAAGNINLSSGETSQLSDALQDQVDEHEALKAEFERRKQLRTIKVPTQDAEVIRQLRQLGHPRCLFGEDPSNRRDRLRVLLTALGGAAANLKKREGADEESDEEADAEVWYHEGPVELKEHRYKIAAYSLARSRERLKNARVKLSHPDTQANPERQKLHSKLRQFSSYCSQVGDTRPVSWIEFSPDGKKLVTGSWSGLCKVWSVPECKELKVFKGHNQRVGAISWHPQACLSQDSSALNMASCDADGVVRLWSLDSETPIASLEGHPKRVPRLAFHPGGKYLGTACYDNSWRLWDLETKTELLHQEGHSRSVYAIAFHKDGSLVGTGGLDAQARIWDLRSGKCELLLQAHVKEILAIDFSSNGYHCVTGSEDHTVRLWDLRQRKSVYTIPSHTKLVSSLKYHADGETLVTCSFDNTVKLWAMPACIPLKTLNGHEGKVMCADISPDSNYVASASYDRTFKLWAADL